MREATCPKHFLKLKTHCMPTTLKTKDGHRATVKKQNTPHLLTPCVFNISIFSKEPGKKKEVIHTHKTCFQDFVGVYISNWQKKD